MTKFQHRNTALCGAIFCLLAVAIGAFGSHALKELLIANDRLGIFELANRYQFYHGLALLALAALFTPYNAQTSLRLTTYLMAIGVLVFSGSLYALALTNATILGAITPIGGVLLITAWALTIWQIFRAHE